jgi:hypothetical protein
MPYPALDIALPTKEDENSWIAIVSRYTNKWVVLPTLKRCLPFLMELIVRESSGKLG